MRSSVFDSIDSLDTFLAIMVGTLHAAGGAMAAKRVQDRIGQRRCGQDAAWFFDEIPSSVDLVPYRAAALMEPGERCGGSRDAGLAAQAKTSKICRRLEPLTGLEF